MRRGRCNRWSGGQAASGPHLLLLGEIHDRKQQWKEAAGAYRRALAFPHGSDLLIRLARAEYRAGNPQAVIETLQPLAGSPEATGEAYFLLALSQGRQGDLEQSVAHLSKAVEKQPDVATYRFQFALALGESGDLGARGAGTSQNPRAGAQSGLGPFLPGADPAQHEPPRRRLGGAAAGGPAATRDSQSGLQPRTPLTSCKGTMTRRS